jgi:ribose 5-phosphate isomerase B
MKVAVAADHAGFDMKQWLAVELGKGGYTIIDLGVHSTAPSDYPDQAQLLGKAVLSGQAERGILVCGSGVGASIAANKIIGIRAAVCHDCYSAHQGVEHDDMNILCLGSRIIGPMPALEIAQEFLTARFSNEERHARRVNKVKKMEQHQR